jgi:SAM-dependent methyltransferase
VSWRHDGMDPAESRMTRPPEAPASADRLAREIAHHRDIAERADQVWNWDSPAGRRRAARRAGLFVEQARLGPPSQALELGCGTGVFLEQVARCGARVRALDLSMELLARARERVRGVSNVQLTCGNAEQMPFPDASYDAVYGSSVLHHLHLERALREVHRVLRPRGTIVFTEPNILNPQVALMFHCGPLKGHFAVSPDEMAFSRFHVARLLRRLGYARVDVTPFDFLHPAVPEPWVDRAARLGERVERMPLLREIAGSLLICASKD